MTLAEKAELEMLREFYDCWKTFHATPKDLLHRSRLERAAQSMVDAAETLDRYTASLVAEPEAVQ